MKLFSKPSPAGGTQAQVSQDTNIRQTFSNKRATGILTVALFAVIGGFFLIRSFAATPLPLTVKIKGDKFVDQNNQILDLMGVNRPGIEYACSQMHQFISDDYSAGAGGTNIGKTQAYADTVAAALLKWDKPGTPLAGPHAINTVRLPLNEQCWLGISGADPLYSGANYQNFVKRLVTNLTNQNMYVVVADHWSAPGNWLPGTANGSTGVGNGQNVAPNADHSPAFWQSVANTFKDSPNVMFDLFTEPGLQCPNIPGCNGTYDNDDAAAWKIYRDGGTYTYGGTAKLGYNENGNTDGLRTGQSWQVAGLNGLMQTIRATGAKNPAIVESLGWGGGGYVDKTAAYWPHDPLIESDPSLGNQIAFSTHGYNHLSGFDYSNLDPQLSFGGVTGKYPFYLGEWGTMDHCGPGTAPDSTYITGTVNWLLAKHYAGTAWGWDAGEGCWGPGLIAGPGSGSGNDQGIPSAYGAALRTLLQAHQGSTGGGTVPTPTNPKITVSSSATTATAPASYNITATSDIAATINITTASGSVKSCSAVTSCVYNATGISASTYVYTATGTTSGGGTGSASTTVTVSQGTSSNKPPIVSLSTAAPSPSVTAPASVSLTATASDSDGSVSKVQLFINGTASGSPITKAPYTFLLNSIQAGTYNYTVQATDNAGATSALSNAVKVTVTSPTTSGVPLAPTNVKGVVKSSTQVDLNWTASSNAVNYLVLRNGGGSGGSIGWTSGATSYSDTTAIPNTTYYYSVIAYGAADSTGVSPSSPASADTIVTTSGATDTSAPSAPTNVVATVVNANKVSLTWTASTDNVGVTGYDIVRTTTSPVTSTTFSSATTSYTDTTTLANTTYSYKVVAKDAAGHFTSSSVVSAVTPSVSDTTKPLAPTGVTATVVSSVQINLTWTASSDASGIKSYNVYRNGVLVSNIATTSFGDTGLTAGTTYSYTLEAIDGAGNVSSPRSTAVSATTKALPTDSAPVWPSTSTVSLGVYSNWLTAIFQGINPACSPRSGCYLDVKWSPSATDDNGISSYEVWRSAPGVSSSRVGITNGSTYTYRDTGVTDNVKYQYTIKAVDNATTPHTTVGPSATKTIGCNGFKICN